MSTAVMRRKAVNRVGFMHRSVTRPLRSFQTPFRTVKQGRPAYPAAVPQHPSQEAGESRGPRPVLLPKLPACRARRRVANAGRPASGCLPNGRERCKNCHRTAQCGGASVLPFHSSLKRPAERRYDKRGHSGGTSRKARVIEELEPAGRVPSGDADPVGAGRGRLPHQSDPLRRRTRHRRDRGDRPLPARDSGRARRDGLAALLSGVFGRGCEFSQPARRPQPLPLPPVPRGLRGRARRLYRGGIHGGARGAAHSLSRSGVSRAGGLFLHLPGDARRTDGRGRAPDGAHEVGRARDGPARPRRGLSSSSSRPSRERSWALSWTATPSSPSR